MATTDWRHRAACRDEDPELFFPIGSSGPALLQTAQAKAVCHGCTVASNCLTWALQTGQDDGVWGGMSEDERRALKRRDGRRREPTVPVGATARTRTRTNKSDTTLDLTVVERALKGEDVGRRLFHPERLAVARRVVADGGGYSRVMVLCGCGQRTAKRLIDEVKNQAA